MAKKVIDSAQANIWYGLEAEKLKFNDRVDLKLEDGKLACYQTLKTVMGNDHGTNLLRVPLYRVNGFLLETVDNIKKLADLETDGDKMQGENVKEAAEWLAENATAHKKVLVLSYKGAKNAPVNIIFDVQLVGRHGIKKFTDQFEIDKEISIKEYKAKLDNK